MSTYMYTVLLLYWSCILQQIFLTPPIIPGGEIDFTPLNEMHAYVI